MNMDMDRRVDVGTLLGSIAEMMEQNQQNLNGVDSGPRGGTHGDRITSAFRTAAQAAGQTRTDDAGEQLARAAQAMRQNGQGKAVGYYADGLEDAAQQFKGQNGISLDNLAPFMQSFLGGVQRNNPAQPGQGTMIDALGPAVGALINNRGGDPRRSALEALAESVTGARQTARDGRVDPGAASATNVIGGIVKALLPGIMTAILSKGLSGGLGGLLGGGGRQEQPQMPTYPQQDPRLGDRDTGGGGGLGDLIGQVMGGGSNRGGGYDTRGNDGGGLMDDLGDILGRLGGSGQQQSPSGGQRSGNPGWWPF
jgi:hypothetical protein